MMSPTLPTVPPVPWWRLSDKVVLTIGLIVLVLGALLMLSFLGQRSAEPARVIYWRSVDIDARFGAEQYKLVSAMLAAMPANARDAAVCSASSGSPGSCLALLDNAVVPWLRNACAEEPASQAAQPFCPLLQGRAMDDQLRADLMIDMVRAQLAPAH